MKNRVMYIEHKTDQNDKGNAWIGEVEFSKSGQTIYFNGQAFKKSKRSGGSSNYYDLETGEGYWISGVKKNTQDRHWAGSGKIKVDREVAYEYLKSIDVYSIKGWNYELVDIKPTDKQKFKMLENK